MPQALSYIMQNVTYLVALPEKKMQDNAQKPSRRGFFFGAAAAGAAVAAVTSLPGLQGVTTTAAVVKPPPEKGGGYSVSDHVERYYKTTRV